MPIFNDTLLTQKGYEAANRAVNGQGSYTIYKAVASAKDYRDYSNSALRQLTSLDNEVPGMITDQGKIDSTTSKIVTNYSNEPVPNGYTANTVGLYAKDVQNNSFLYAVTTSQIGQVIPEQSNNVFSGFELEIYVVVGNVQNMKVELTPNASASIEYVNTQTTKQFDNSVNYANTNFVKDNHNGIVENAGQQFAMNAPLAPCGLNSISTDGIYHSTDVIGKYGDIIADVFDTRTLSKFTLFVFHNDLDIYQTIYTPGMQPFYRTRYGTQWSEWEKLSGSDSSNIYKGYVGNFDVKALPQGTFNITYGSHIDGFNNVVTSAPNGAKIVKRWFDNEGYNGSVTLYLPNATYTRGWSGGSSNKEPDWAEVKVVGFGKRILLPTKVCDIVNLNYHYKPNSSIDIQAYFDVDTMTVHLDGWVNGGDQNLGIQIDAECIYSMLGQNKPVYISGYSTNGSTGVWEDTLRGNKVIDRNNGIVVGIGAAGKFYWDNVTINLAFTN